MKRFFTLTLAVCLIFSLAVTAFATYDVADYIAKYSSYVPEPVPEDYGGVTPEFMAAHDAWVAGLHDFARSEEEAKRQSAVEDIPSDAPPITPTESEGPTHAVSSDHVDAPVDFGSDDKYPVGSRVDPAGNVYSPSGELLSPGTTPASAPVPDLDEDGSVSSDELADPDISSASSGIGPVLLMDSPLAWYVEDLRPADVPAEGMTGLKALVNSIFGEYTPVTTTSIVTETKENETYQYLIETVAPGAAGVDYEWIAGVVFFGIMLFCLMKLLGGVLK